MQHYDQIRRAMGGGDYSNEEIEKLLFQNPAQPQPKKITKRWFKFPNYILYWLLVELMKKPFIKNSLVTAMEIYEDMIGVFGDMKHHYNHIKVRNYLANRVAHIRAQINEHGTAEISTLVSILMDRCLLYSEKYRENAASKYFEQYGKVYPVPGVTRREYEKWLSKVVENHTNNPNKRKRPKRTHQTKRRKTLFCI